MTNISRNGSGVIAIEQISINEIVLTFQGKLVSKTELPFPYKDDKYLQIGIDFYIGPSGDIDDYVNHSCNPNCRVVVDGTNAKLVALRDIAIDEEISFDYAITMHDDDWVMECNCGSSSCRTFIKENISGSKHSF